MVRTVQTTLERFGGRNNEELRELVERRIEVRNQLDGIRSTEAFGGLRRIQLVGQLEEIDEQIVELANLQVGHHSMTRVVVNRFIEGMI